MLAFVSTFCLCVHHPAHFFQTCAVLYPCVSPRSCHHVSQPVFLKSMKPASWLIRAGIQPPRLHLTISHWATYSIISCLTWRVLLSLTQADRKFPFISCTKLAGCSQTKREPPTEKVYIMIAAGGAKFTHSAASLPQPKTENLCVFCFLGKLAKNFMSENCPCASIHSPYWCLPILCICVPLSECTVCCPACLAAI